MPMPKFPYGQGRFLRVVNRIWQDHDLRWKALRDLRGGKLDGITDDWHGDPALPPEKKIAKASRDHFRRHWLAPDGNGRSPSFPEIEVERIERVMREGYIRGLEASCDPKNGGSKQKPLPMSVAWVCNADSRRFEVVCSVNEGVHVQVILITPQPLEFEVGGHKADRTWVTRFFADAGEVTEVKNKLNGLGDPEAKVLDPQGRDIHDPGDGEVGTFQIWL